jgi:peptidoglycan hydrolase-like protein with peptidoglycan-binding domain
MKAQLSLATLLTALVWFIVPAQADYNAGMAAYQGQDYTTAYQEFRPLAEQGHGESQAMLGYLYAYGRGVPVDYVQSYRWFNLAAAQGTENAAAARDELAKHMTPTQVAEAQQLSQSWSDPTPAPVPLPEPSAPASREVVAGVQSELSALGYRPGPADGLMGTRTRNAISAYQADMGLPITGEASQALLDHLRSTVAERGVTAPAAPAAPTAASPATGGGDAQLGQMVAELKALIDKGQSGGQASSAYLDELRQLAARYDVSPWPLLLFSDDFADGNHSANPVWTVVSGQAWVEPGFGLRSRYSAAAPSGGGTQSSEDATAKIIGTLLSEVLRQQGGTQSGTAPATSEAEVFTSARISNAFAIEFDYAESADANSQRLEVGPFQGANRAGGYRLSLASGNASQVQLLRVSSTGTAVIDSAQLAQRLDDAQRHRVRWERDGEGQMTVLIDGQPALSTLDRAYQAAFDGLMLVNRGGDYSVGGIKVYGTQ